MRHHDDDMSGPGCELKECGCGRLLLRIGRVRLDISREELNELHQLLAVATEQLFDSNRTAAKLTRH